MPNPEKPSVIKNQNQSMAAITTAGQNKIHFEDLEGKQRILFKTPTANSWIRVGSHNDPPALDASQGIDLDGDDTTKEIEYSNGIRIHSDENLWTEARERYADYKVAGPEVRDEVPEDVKYLWDKFYGSSPDFDPTGMQLYSYGKDKDKKDIPNPVSQDDLAALKKLAKKGRVKLTKGDTFNAQQGNVYDFRGYWVYNLGNSYVENHLDEGNKANLNEPWDKDLSVPDVPNATGGPNNDIKCNDLDVKDKLTAPRYEWIWELEGGDFHNSGAVPGFSKTLDSKNTWVEKTLGGAKYNYTKGTRTLNVEVGTAQEAHIYGRASYEYKYSKGKLISKTVSKGGHSEEWKYDRETGVILAHNKTDWIGAGGVLLTSSFSMAHKTSFNMSASLSETLSLSLSGKVDVDFSFAAKAKIGIGAALDFVCYWNPSGKITLDNTGLKYRGIGYKMSVEEAVNAGIQKLMINSVKTDLKESGLELKDIKLLLNTKKIDIETGDLTLHI